jgi:hypothetical protein
VKSLNVISAVWFVLLCGLFVFSTPMAERLWLAYLAVHWGCVVVGGVVLVTATVALIRRRRAAVLALCVTAVGLEHRSDVGYPAPP